MEERKRCLEIAKAFPFSETNSELIAEKYWIGNPYAIYVYYGAYDVQIKASDIAYTDKKVFKLQFTVGEFDMDVFDSKALTCQIFEVKYSKEQVTEQYRHLKDEQKCAMTSHRYGDITSKYVIYREENVKVDDVQYLKALTE